MEVKCDLVKDLLPLYVENLCGESSKNIVNEHIASCQSCSKLLTDLTNNNEVTISKNEVKKALKPFKKNKKKKFNCNNFWCIMHYHHYFGAVQQTFSYRFYRFAVRDIGNKF